MSSILSKGAKKDAAKKKPSKTFSGNKTWFVFAIVAAVAAAGLIFAILSQLVSTTTYYVLKNDVPARSQITPEMLTEVVASSGSEPRNAIGLAEVQYEPVYAKFALNTGDILTASNTGGLTPLQESIPEDYVVASFVADANNAVAGKLATGNYIDLIAIGGPENSSDVAKVALRHVLVMDVSADPSAIGESQNQAKDENGNPLEGSTATSSEDQLRSGIPSLYTVALPVKDAAKLALIRDADLFVVLSPKADSTDKFTPADITANKGEIFSDKAVDNSGKGTDPTFGNGKVSTSDNADSEESTPSASPSASREATK
jgi:hypothetical protein